MVFVIFYLYCAVHSIFPCYPAPRRRRSLIKITDKQMHSCNWLLFAMPIGNGRLFGLVDVPTSSNCIDSHFITDLSVRGTGMCPAPYKYLSHAGAQVCSCPFFLIASCYSYLLPDFLRAICNGNEKFKPKKFAIAFEKFSDKLFTTQVVSKGLEPYELADNGHSLSDIL